MVDAIAAAAPTLRLPLPALSNANTTLQVSRRAQRHRYPQIHSKKWSLHFNTRRGCWAHVIPKVAASAGFAVEPTTNVKFQTTVQVPGCSNTLTLLGTGFREKVFAIIGVKVYAVGLYMNPNIKGELNGWEGKTIEQIQKDSSLFTALFQASLEKSLQIVLVRDVDGKTFWDALDDAISPRITTPTSIDQAALSTFRKTFQGRPLKKGTLIFLTWVQPSKMLLSISTDELPASVDASIESMNVTSSLFDVFFGNNPVSPTLKASVSSGLESVLYVNMQV